MSDELTKQLLDELKFIKSNMASLATQDSITEMKSQIDQKLTKIDNKLELIDKKIDTIYLQVASNTEFQTTVKSDHKEIKDQLTFNTYKIVENEKDLFFLKKRIQ